MNIEGLQRYQRRHERGCYFEGLPAPVRALAYQILKRLCERWRGDLPQWRRAILVGRAKWLALRRPDSAWGRSMRAKKGGYAVQRIYRLEGRIPTSKATLARQLRARRPTSDQSSEPEIPDLTAITLSGACRTGWTGREQADFILKEISRLISLDSNFGQHIAPPICQWEWELRLTPVS